MLATVASTAYVDDMESATSVLAMRKASKNILYTVANSLAYGENADRGLAQWKVTLIIIDVILLILLAALEIFALRKLKKMPFQ